MLSIFSTPKPFQGHVAIIQRNAVRSWCKLPCASEVILVGDEPGTEETANELGIKHVGGVLRNPHGTKFLRSIFDLAEANAKHDLMCYVNCDIMLTSDFAEAVERVSAWRRKFLLVGRRTDVNITLLWDLEHPRWEERLRELALEEGSQRPSSWIDYFVFSRGTFAGMPPFVIGRAGWDNWLIWKACSENLPVVDATPSVIAVHQNHNYDYHPEGQKGVWQDEEARRNYELAGGWSHCYSINDTTHLVTPEGIRRNLTMDHLASRLEIARRWSIDTTRPLRHRLGLKRRA